MKLQALKGLLPDWKNTALALLSAILLILAFPDFEYWFLAWFALVPLMFAVEREKGSPARGFVLGWIFGVVFFFGTCWWLTFAPITYAGFPALLAYFLLLCLTALVAIFPGIFAAVLAVVLKRFGSIAILSAPFIWVFAEFLRYWLTGNNWNAIGYSQAFARWWGWAALEMSSLGGVWLATGYTVAINCAVGMVLFNLYRGRDGAQERIHSTNLIRSVIGLFVVLILMPTISGVLVLSVVGEPTSKSKPIAAASVIAIQPNVPMSGLTQAKWRQLRQKHVQLAESALAKLNEQRTTNNEQPTTVIFPESPMNFTYDEDPEFQEFVSRFAAKHNVHVLFNSAEPDTRNKKYYNSAVLVDPQGKEVAQYDKIYLVPFGESVPAPLQSIVPAFVGSFSYGNEYDLLPLGDAKAGVMICFESHFGELSREYVRNGADVIIEMTNDGYLGPTPVLRQHLANAVFRAVETNRPVLRVTNVGITAYINERGEVLDPTESYTEDTRIWNVSRSDGSQTFYVKYGDWFAWLCSVVTIALLLFSFTRKRITIEG